MKNFIAILIIWYIYGIVEIYRTIQGIRDDWYKLYREDVLKDFNHYSTIIICTSPFLAFFGPIITLFTWYHDIPRKWYFKKE